MGEDGDFPPLRLSGTQWGPLSSVSIASQGKSSRSVELYVDFHLLSRLICRDLSPDSHVYTAWFLVIKTDLLPL